VHYFSDDTAAAAAAANTSAVVAGSKRCVVGARVLYRGHCTVTGNRLRSRGTNRGITAVTAVLPRLLITAVYQYRGYAVTAVNMYIICRNKHQHTEQSLTCTNV
jgi:hypothetical protein